MATMRELVVFAALDGEFAPAGLLNLTGENERLLASEFAYGTRYIDRSNALEIDPVSLSLKNKEAIRGKKLSPENGMQFLAASGMRRRMPGAAG